jgi:hypothetical protein
MDVDEGSKVKYKKRKGSSSPTPLENSGKVASPTPFPKSFKEMATLSTYKVPSSLKSVTLSKIFSGIRNPLLLKRILHSFFGILEG